MKKIIAAFTLGISLIGVSALAQTGNKTSTSTATATKRPGDPIPGVGVNLKQMDGNVSKIVQTDAKGQFEFTDLPAGRYLLTIVQAESTVQSPRELASGIATGKREPGATSAKDTSQSGQNQETSRIVNTSRSNIKTQKVVTTTEIAETPEPTPTTRVGISTSRSNIPRSSKKAALLNDEKDEEVIVVQITNSADPASKQALTALQVLETAGLTITVGTNGRLNGNVLKTRHDTVKNSINNVR